MKTPFSRADFSIASTGPVSSPTRASADLHQWWSHMSQTMIAVFFAPHSATRSGAALDDASIGFGRLRSFSFSVPAGSAAGVNTANARATRTAGTNGATWEDMTAPRVGGVGTVT